MDCKQEINIDNDESKTNKPAVSIVIPTFNRKQMLTRLIDSAKASTYSPEEIIVVDDCSTDGTVDHIHKLYPDAKIIKNEKKSYLAESRNRGARIAKGHFIFFVDDDNILHPQCIEHLVNLLIERPTCGICGPFIYYHPRVDKLRFAGSEHVGAFTKIIGLNMDKELVRVKLPDIISSDDIPNSFIVRAEIFKVHNIFFDIDSFPIHYDESDFANRVKNRGYVIYTLKNAEIFHDEDIIFKTKDLLRSLNLNTPTRVYYNIRNKILYNRKYFSQLEFPFVFIFSIAPFILFQMALISTHSKGIQMKNLMNSYIRGMRDGLFRR